MKESYKRAVIFTIIIISINILIPRTASNNDKLTLKSEKKQIIRKTYIPELIIDCRNGDNNKHYSLYEPLGIVTDSRGDIFVLDCRNSRIVKYNKNLKYIKSIGEQGRGPGQFIIAKGSGRSNLAIDGSDILYLIDNKNFRVNIFSNELQFIESFQTLLQDYFTITVDSNKDIYLSKNPSTTEESGDLFTIHKYSKSKDGYVFTKGFSKCLAWTPKINLSFLEHTKILNLSRSIIKTGLNDTVYQIFYSLPIIRKFNKNGDILFQKMIAPKILKEEGWQDSELKNIFNLNQSLDTIKSQKVFITFIDYYVNKNTDTLLLLMQSQKILELDNNCNPITQLIPDEKLSNLSTSSDDEYCSNLRKGHFSFTYDLKSNHFLFLNYNTGEIWFGYN